MVLRAFNGVGRRGTRSEKLVVAGTAYITFPAVVELGVTGERLCRHHVGAIVSSPPQPARAVSDISRVHCLCGGTLSESSSHCQKPHRPPISPVLHRGSSIGDPGICAGSLRWGGASLGVPHITMPRSTRLHNARVNLLSDLQ